MPRVPPVTRAARPVKSVMAGRLAHAGRPQERRRPQVAFRLRRGGFSRGRLCRMEPSITMTGNLVSDPVRRVTAAGVVVTRLRLASNHRRFDRERGEWISADPVYLDVNCWRQ